MPSALFSSLNSSFTFGIQRAVSVKQIGRYNLTLSLPVQSSHTWNCRYSSYLCNTRVMAFRGSAAALGDIVVDSLISSSANPASVYFGDRIWKTSMSLESRKMKSSFIFDVSHGSSIYCPVTRRGLKSYCTSSTPTCSDGSLPNEHLASLAIPIEQKAVGNGPLKLVSASCYLPHPDKVRTGGEDAHFICEDEMAIGVADGVGGWADVGIDAGEFARQLMSYSVDVLRHEPKDSISPTRVLKKAHSKTNAQGSSTACIIVLTSKGLRAINLGDSGFVVVRDGRTIFESPVQQHGFNCPYQLESGSGGNSNADLPSSGQVFAVDVKPGDVIVAGTDGLFDNLYKDEIARVVHDAVKSGLDPDTTAQKITGLARQRALDSKRQTPFADAAQKGGFHYYGGKLDDLTVIVSFITHSSTAA
ncbi:unnamed protein product [Cuscuta epithymum]|nr:unnamed protein product [Cuscuta epithymum]